jgi:hypothetical protein
MSEPLEFINLPSDAFISLINDSDTLVDIGKTFQISEYVTRSIEHCDLPNTDRKYEDKVRNNWSIEGIKVKTLILGEKWRTGRVHLTIEFCPDSPEPQAKTEDSAISTDQDLNETDTDAKTTDPKSEDPGSLLDDIRQTLLQQDTP